MIIKFVLKLLPTCLPSGLTVAAPDAFGRIPGVKLWVSEIACLTSHATLFQLYMWRHIDVQADWSSGAYGRTPNAIDIS